MEYLAVCPSC